MKTISRFHHFQNILTYIERGRKFYYLWHEKSARPIKILRNPILDKAFEVSDFVEFEKAEAEYLGGEKC